jgi:PAB-dependent poly(A)-specific ribonuclease subunit 2
MFDYASLNDTLFPGYDYPPTMSNSYVCPVLLLLYFIPEIHNAMLHSQQRAVAHEINGKKSNKNAALLSSELGFLFHQINSISAHAMCHPNPSGAFDDPCRPIVGTFIPSNFLSAFVTMQEAVSLALLDDSPAAAEIARRPEAFYRFLLHHLDRELSTENVSKGTHENSNKVEISQPFKLIDSLQGLDSVSMNEFITGAGPPSANLNRTYTVELSYESFLTSPDQDMPEFIEILQYSLSKYIRLRAWCEATKQYETVVQRKIITSLPNILSLSCACAGIHAEEKLNFWRKSKADNSSWLPEMIEVEIDERGNVVTRQLVQNVGSQEPIWDEFRGKPLPDGVVSTLQTTLKNQDLPRPLCCRYRLDTVLTYLNDSVSEGSEQNCGRHIIHTRIPKSYKKKILSEQLANLKECLHDSEEFEKLTLLRDIKEQDFKKRIQYVQDQIKELDAGSETPGDDWALFNGPNVSSTTVEDALAFHVPFKEPCILVYRKVNFETHAVSEPKLDIPVSLWTNTPLHPKIPQKGDTIAFDAEFVQVESEASILTATGSRIVTREGRNAIGRISLLDSNTGKELVDDYVVPREPVVDYLTRFSGITPSDLNPKTSKHHLITARSAYLKMRYLVDR